MKEIICADIGGTNVKFCVAQTQGDGEISIHEIIHYQTSHYQDFITLLCEYMETLSSAPKHACFAVAGLIENQRIQMTNAALVIDALEIVRRTKITKAFVVNDFSATGYAVNSLSSEDFQTIQKGVQRKHAVRSIIGAGTGLGKSYLVYRNEEEYYEPLVSEGGHGQLPLANAEEFALIEQISLRHQATYEDLLSGKGLERIYQALQKTRFPQEEAHLTAKMISARRQQSPCCRGVFDLFMRLYARCAKNFALDTYALGGIYIAGGIASANFDQFDQRFNREFTDHPLPRFRQILQEIPVLVITNELINLKGAAIAFLKNESQLN